MTPAEFLRNYHGTLEPKLAFEARTQEELKAWQAELRAKLRELLGLDLMDEWRCELEPEEGETEDLGSYTRQRVTIQTAPGLRMPMYVLRPKAAGPFKPALALHGHGLGKTDICGIAENEEQEKGLDRLNYRYAVHAVERGYLVFAPDKRGFGELREERDRRAGKGCSCEWLNMSAILLGMSEIGLHVWDLQRLLDYVETREDCEKDGAAAFGVSGGGQATMWLSAIDARISVAVISGHLGSFHDSILLQDGCCCNGIPGLLRWAEKGDIAGLIAPRPLLVESGSEDNAYSRKAQLAAYEVVERIYEVAGVPDRLDIDLYEGPHQWSGRKAWDWLERWL